MNIIRRTLLLSIVSVTFGSFVSNAQDAPPPSPSDAGASTTGGAKKIGYGAKVGIGLSNFSKEEFKVGNKVGFMVGGFVNYKVIKILTVQMEVMYMQQGGKEMTTSIASLSGLVSSETSITKTTLHNIEIPLLAKVTPPGLGDVFGLKPHVLIGPALGINLGATNVTTTDIEFTSGRSVVVKERGPVSPNNFETIQWGAYIGAGFETQLKSFLLSVDVRYRQGLNSINPNYDMETFVHGFGDGKSNTIALTVGIGF